MTVIKSLLYTFLGSIYVMFSYFVVPPIIENFGLNSSIASIAYVFLLLTWVFAVIGLPMFIMYKVVTEGNLVSSIITFFVGILLLFFGYFMIPGLINAISWEGTNGTIAKAILWIGWMFYLISAIAINPIYQIIANKKDNKWINN